MQEFLNIDREQGGESAFSSFLNPQRPGLTPGPRVLAKGFLCSSEIAVAIQSSMGKSDI